LYYYSKNKKAINAINRSNAINTYPSNADKNNCNNSQIDNKPYNEKYLANNKISNERKAYSDDSINKEGQSEDNNFN
jgi:hypothetical protein